MKKNIFNSTDLLKWCSEIILNEEFQREVYGIKVYYWFSTLSFQVEGELGVGHFDIEDIPAVLKDADTIVFFAHNDTLMFRAQFNSESE